MTVDDKIRAACDLLDQTRNTFRSKQVQRARELLEGALTDMANTPRTTIVLPDDLRQQVLTRGEQSQVIRGDLERYYGLMQRELPALREMFSLDEQLLIADSMNGWASRMEPVSILLSGLRAGDSAYTVIGAHVEDSIQYDGLADKWEVDGATLVARLNTLSRVQVLALVDAIERWWANDERTHDAVL